MNLVAVPASSVTPDRPRYFVGTEWRAQQILDEERETPGSAPKLWAEPLAFALDAFARLCGRDPATVIAIVEDAAEADRLARVELAGADGCRG